MKLDLPSSTRSNRRSRLRRPWEPRHVRAAASMVTTLHVPPLPRLRAVLSKNGTSRCGEFVNVSHTSAALWAPYVGDHTVIANGLDPAELRHAPRVNSCHAIWARRTVPYKGLHLASAAAHEAGLPVDIAGPVHDEVYSTHNVAVRMRPSDRYLRDLHRQDLADQLKQRAVGGAL